MKCAVGGVVIIFVKAPVAGRVKTRLGAQVGMGRAAALFRLLTMHTIAQARKGPWRTVLAVDPPGAMAGFDALWPADLPRLAQGPGNLGGRMAGAMNTAPHGPVVIIGADAPGLRTRHLHQAFARLRGADAVFGPAQDGGYWLIGLARRRGGSRTPPGLFEGVRWSSAYALGDTARTLPGSYRVAMLETLRDVDEAGDLAVMGPRSRA